MEQHCYKYYFGMLSEDKTMIDHLVLYIDTIHDDESRTVEVPLLKKTFEKGNIIEPFFEAISAIQKEFGMYSSDRAFVMPAWQGDEEPVRHNIQFEKLAKYIKAMEDEKFNKDIEKPIQKNFWDFI